MKALLRATGTYERLRQSKLADAYFAATGSEVTQIRTQDLARFRPFIQPGDFVYDIGANAGDKTDVFLRLGARVLAIDPDPANADRLRRRFVDWRAKKPPVTVLEAAVSDRMGTAQFWIPEPGSALSSLVSGQGRAVTVSTRTLDDLIADYGRPAFIKIDVEGAERFVLAGLRCHAIPLCFEINLPERRAEGLDCFRLLHATGECRTDHTPWMPLDDFRALVYPACDGPIDVYYRPPTEF